MQFAFADDHTKFRAEVVEFIAEHARASQEADSPPGAEPANVTWSPTFSRRLRDQGWLGLPLPQEHGGAGKDPMYQAIFNEEMAYHRAPVMAHWRGVFYVAPILLRFATDDQRDRFLPPILSCEMLFANGMSEPQAGSDLAGLSTRADRQGDDYVINGSKIWTSDAHHAGWIWLAARTNQAAPKHRGISNFVVDLTLPGVDIRPILDINGEHHFNQVFFSDVVVPASCLIGEEDRGWYQTATALDFERSSIANFAGSQRVIDDLIEDVRGDKLPRPLTRQLRNRLSELYVRLAAGRMLSYNVAFMQSKGIVPNKEASIAKLMSSEIRQDVARLLVDIFGLHGQRTDGGLIGAGVNPARSYTSAIAATIAGGTSEVQRGIIATRGVGMPRS
jgi:3-oxocholest-4-en-26-oyl-CoA dehydrogenase alpha subunit